MCVQNSICHGATPGSIQKLNRCTKQKTRVYSQRLYTALSCICQAGKAVQHTITDDEPWRLYYKRPPAVVEGKYI